MGSGFLCCLRSLLLKNIEAADIRLSNLTCPSVNSNDRPWERRLLESIHTTLALPEFRLSNDRQAVSDFSSDETLPSRSPQRLNMVVKPNRLEPFDHFGSPVGKPFEFDVRVIDVMFDEMFVEATNRWEMAAVFCATRDLNSKFATNLLEILFQ